MVSQIYGKVVRSDLPRSYAHIDSSDLWILRTTNMPRVTITLGERFVPIPSYEDAVVSLGVEGTYTVCRTDFASNRIHVPVGRPDEPGWRFTSRERPSIYLLQERLMVEAILPRLLSPRCPSFQFSQILGLDKPTVRWICRLPSSVT